MSENLDTLIRVIARHAGPLNLRRLNACRQCRNSLLYLLDVPPETLSRALMTRLDALPDRHAGHLADHTADTERPQITGLGDDDSEAEAEASERIAQFHAARVDDVLADAERYQDARSRYDTEPAFRDYIDQVAAEWEPPEGP